jgi:hypothetical protein
MQLSVKRRIILFIAMFLFLAGGIMKAGSRGLMTVPRLHTRELTEACINLVTANDFAILPVPMNNHDNGSDDSGQHFSSQCMEVFISSVPVLNYKCYFKYIFLIKSARFRETNSKYINSIIEQQTVK